MTPLTVKNAASRRRRSPGRTIACSYTRSAVTAATPIQYHQPSESAAPTMQSAATVGECAADAEACRDGVQTLARVDLDVEQRIEEIEPGDPGRDGRAENPCLPRQSAGDRDPTAHRRKAVGDTEQNVTEPGPALQVRVDDEQNERNRPQPANDVRKLKSRNNVYHGRRDTEERDLQAREQTGGQLARGGSRIPRIELRVDQAVESHRRRTRADHRDGDPHEVVRRGNTMDREKRADVGKWQRKDGVLDLHQPGEPRRKRDGAHVARCSVRSPASSSSAWASAGFRIWKPSRHPPGEPGRFTISVRPRTPATPRPSNPWGVCRVASARRASAIPGTGRSITEAVASGVKSR